MCKSQETKKELRYLKAKLCEVNYKKNRFSIRVGNDRILVGVLLGGNEAADSFNSLSKLFQCKTVYETVLDLDWKIKTSFEKAMNYAYSKPVQRKYNLLSISSYEEGMAYYYIENAIFRTSSTWDMLAQLYRIFYDIEIEKERVYYKKIFDPKNSNSSKFGQKAIEIYDYINQEDDDSVDGEWKGNHSYINAVRNQMTHRNSPNLTTTSDFALQIKPNPAYVLKRAIEDYVTVFHFVEEILEEIEVSFKKDAEMEV